MLLEKNFIEKNLINNPTTSTNSSKILISEKNRRNIMKRKKEELELSDECENLNFIGARLNRLCKQKHPRRASFKKDQSLCYLLGVLLIFVKSSDACFPSSRINNRPVGEDKEPNMSTLKKEYEAKECPMPFQEIYCFNKGRCYAEILENNDFIPFCKCPPNYHGQRCEHVYHEDLYIFEQFRPAETAALSIIVVLIVMGIFLITCLLYYYRKVGREQELYNSKTTSKVNSTAMTPDALANIRIPALFSQLPTISQSQHEAVPFLQPQFSVGETSRISQQEFWVLQKRIIESSLPRRVPEEVQKAEDENKKAPIASEDESL